jgi:hypothetical protein
MTPIGNTRTRARESTPTSANRQTRARRRPRLPSPALIVAFVALVVALGGVSYAAAVLPKNSVGTAQLKKKAVTAAKLKKNAVTSGKVRRNAISSAKVKDRTLLAQDFKPGQLPAGPQGPKGDPGAQGPAGIPGPAGISGLESVQSSTITLGGGQTNEITASCPAGKKALAGGWETQSGVFVRWSRPVASNTGWQVLAQNDAPYPAPLSSYAICVNVG